MSEEVAHRENALKQGQKGFGYALLGWRFVGQHPELLKYCILPLVLTLLGFLGISTLFYFYFDEIIGLIWQKPEGWLLVLWWVFKILMVPAMILIGYMVFFVVVGIVAAPFNDLLSEKAEEIAYGTEPKPFSIGYMMRGLGRTLLHELAKLGIYLAWMVPLLLVNFIPAIGSIIFTGVGFWLTARFCAYDNLDFSMARREWSFAKKQKMLKTNRSVTMSFGTGVALFLLIPIVGVLTLPFSAIGGTLLFCDLEQMGAFNDV